MKRIIGIVLIIAVGGLFATPAIASVSAWQNSVSIVPQSSNDFASQDMKNLLAKISADNANYVTLIIPLTLESHAGTRILSNSQTPSDEALIAAIKSAHSNHLKVMLKPHLDAPDVIWRAYIDPTDRNAFYENYESMLTHYAGIAKQYKVEEICIGTELISVAAANVHADNTAHWKKIIADLRKSYSGKLTYSANWGPSNFANEKDHIGFWSDLDYIGISAYFTLATKDNSVASLKNAWAKWDASTIAPLYKKFHKPIIFTEIGYRSVTNAHVSPFDFQKGGNYDPTEQANSYEALFEYWNGKSYVAGVSLWDFRTSPNAGGEGNIDYTPQNKPAETVMKTWFAKSHKVAMLSPKSSSEDSPSKNSVASVLSKLPFMTTIDLVFQQF